MNKYTITIDGYTFEVELDGTPGEAGQATVRVNGQVVQVVAPDVHLPVSDRDWFIVDDRPYEIMIDTEMKWVRSDWGISSLEVQDLATPRPRPTASDGRIKAPIPGQIAQVMVSPGDQVVEGQPLLVLEAMKMENEIRAPCPGQVRALHVAPGQRVTLHEVLAEID